MQFPFLKTERHESQVKTPVDHTLPGKWRRCLHWGWCLGSLSFQASAVLTQTPAPSLGRSRGPGSLHLQGIQSYAYFNIQQSGFSELSLLAESPGQLLEWCKWANAILGEKGFWAEACASVFSINYLFQRLNIPRRWPFSLPQSIVAILQCFLSLVLGDHIWVIFETRPHPPSS